MNRAMKKPTGEEGFTLLEILMAMIILAIGGVGVLSLFAAAVGLQYESVIDQRKALILADVVADAQQVVEKPWFTLPGPTEAGIPVFFKLGVDGISILLVALTAILMPIVILSTKVHIATRVKEFMVWMLLMETGMLGVFLSMDLVLFYFFWEFCALELD